jgi:hypothetical protein
VGKATTDTLTNKTLTSPVLTTPALGTPASGVLTNCTGVAAAALPAGTVLQVVNSQTSTYASGTTIIPSDNTIPQITEGTQFLSLAITPISATSKLLFAITIQLSPSVAASCNTALFQGATANAIAAGSSYQSAGTGIVTMPLTYLMVSGTTSSTTFTVRAGMNIAGTLHLNGPSSPGVFNGTCYSSITITEIAA